MLDSAQDDWRTLQQIEELLSTVSDELEQVVAVETVPAPGGSSARHTHSDVRSLRGALAWVRRHEYDALESDLQQQLDMAIRCALGTLDQLERSKLRTPSRTMRAIATEPAMIAHTIVVIDDELELRGMLKEILEGEGYHVVAVEHPRVIAGAIAGHDPSLFLIDLMLAGSSGIAVAEQLHTEHYGAIPMIAISASDVMIRRAAGSGWFTDTLEKPFDLDALLGCVAEHLAA